MPKEQKGERKSGSKLRIKASQDFRNDSLPVIREPSKRASKKKHRIKYSFRVYSNETSQSRLGSRSRMQDTQALRNMLIDETSMRINDG